MRSVPCNTPCDPPLVVSTHYFREAVLVGLHPLIDRVRLGYLGWRPAEVGLSIRPLVLLLEGLARFASQTFERLDQWSLVSGVAAAGHLVADGSAKKQFPGGKQAMCVSAA